MDPLGLGFGLIPDPMEEVLALQTYGVEEPTASCLSSHVSCPSNLSGNVVTCNSNVSCNSAQSQPPAPPDPPDPWPVMTWELSICIC